MRWLRFYRERAGLTLQKVAEQTGYQLNTIWRWEAGRSSPSVEALHELAVAFGVSESELLNGPTQEAWTLEIEIGERKEVIDMTETMGHVAKVSCTTNGASLLLAGKWDTFRDDEKFEAFVADLRAARGIVLRNGEELEKMRPAAAGA